MKIPSTLRLRKDDHKGILESVFKYQLQLLEGLKARVLDKTTSDADRDWFAGYILALVWGLGPFIEAMETCIDDKDAIDYVRSTYATLQEDMQERHKCKAQEH